MTFHPFHGCPQCPAERGPDDIYTAGKAERGACHAHRTTWRVGVNLTSQWRQELEAVGGDWGAMLNAQHERYGEIEGYEDAGSYWLLTPLDHAIDAARAERQPERTAAGGLIVGPWPGSGVATR
jgi:hypothetical protein